MWTCAECGCVLFPVLRCIPCKGARFPPTLPRPAVAILPFQLPYCQVATEKGQMEVRNGVEFPAGRLRCPWSGDSTAALLIPLLRKRNLSKTRSQGVYLGSVFCGAFLVWSTAVSKWRQNKMGRADAKLYLHMICFWPVKFLSLFFLVGCDARFGDPSQDALENVWVLLF